jgi:hypothetical protein
MLPLTPVRCASTFSQDDEGKGTGKDVDPQAGETLVFGQPMADGEGKRYADNKEEEGKDHVDVGHSIYVSGKMVSPPGKVFDSGEIVHEDHYQDGQAAKDIDRSHPGGDGREWRQPLSVLNFRERSIGVCGGHGISPFQWR